MKNCIDLVCILEFRKPCVNLCCLVGCHLIKWLDQIAKQYELHFYWHDLKLFRRNIRFCLCKYDFLLVCTILYISFTFLKRDNMVIYSNYLFIFLSWSWSPSSSSSIYILSYWSRPQFIILIP